jgi:hypothetical protein
MEYNQIFVLNLKAGFGCEYASNMGRFGTVEVFPCVKIVFKEPSKGHTGKTEVWL